MEQKPAAQESPPGQQQATARPRISERADTLLPPHSQPSITQVPVTPGINFDTYRAYDTPGDEASGAADHGYFAHRDSIASPDLTDLSPSEVAATSKTTENLLGRMSLAAMGRRQSLSQIRATHPDLSLSGNIISATFNIPHSLSYNKGADWVSHCTPISLAGVASSCVFSIVPRSYDDGGVNMCNCNQDLKPRRGQSALFDSFSYLSSDATPWNHTVVAWTGEIEQPPAPLVTPPNTPPNTTVGLKPLNNLSAPVPVNGERPHVSPAPADGLWVSKEDQQRLEYQLSHDKSIKTVPVWLSDDNECSEEGIRLKDQARWRRYAEHDLYTLFHYKLHEPTDGRAERTQWADYFRMNQKFANKILEVYKPGDIVIVHDYYLMLLPSMLRQRAPHMYISFFLHSPFPSSEFLRCLPRRKEILEGLLSSNLVGFQSYSYSRHFASCCTRILGFPSDTTGVDAYGSRVEIGVFPIGIDATKVEKLAFSESVSAKYAALKKLYEGKKIIVGRDRLDSVRGVAQKLMAFERFLELYPQWREKVVLIQVTSPTSIEEEKEENKIARRVNELVTRINGMYGSLGFSPVQHFPQYLSEDEYFALLRVGDIGLITSVRDGMNTTSLEYVVCQRDSAGPLILSEFSGTAGSLKDAIHINPWDLSGVADQINNALTMLPEQRRTMQDHLNIHVTTRNVQTWITGFVRRLVQVLANRKNVVSTPLLDRAAMLSRYRAAHKRLFMFDYDGTLTQIVREPSAAVPSQRVITTLKALAADPKNAVWIISGRDQDFLHQHLGHIKELGFSAEHGSFMKHPGSDDWENLAETFDMGWQQEVLDVFQKYTDKVPGEFSRLR